ncbi:phosphatase PAP2 family protein [Parafrankia sp. BMG5.11]|nr:phosphatase PAP2 family protein [Parafrankia sp. BMG5.11]TCJ38765.1 phosphatase PAP2 family protein [Parafrankia sp. BMG5.11]
MDRTNRDSRAEREAPTDPDSHAARVDEADRAGLPEENDLTIPSDGAARSGGAATAGGVARSDGTDRMDRGERVDRERRAEAPAGLPTPPGTGRFRNPATGLPRLWVEAVVLVGLYYVYTATRGVAGSSVGAATDMGWDILRLQQHLHLDIELSLNRWLQSIPPLAVASCYYYSTLHFVVTPALLVWMYRRHPGRYIRARWALVFTTLISLCGFFLFPTAPPRLLPGTSYVDTMSHFEGWGWWSGGASAAPNGLEGLANQYAAMPSLHCAWALWCGFMLARFARTPLVRVIGCLYPAATVFVVMATSNHYILDAVAGWAVLGVSTLLSLAITARGRRRPAEAPPTPAPATAAVHRPAVAKTATADVAKTATADVATADRAAADRAAGTKVAGRPGLEPDVGQASG